MSYTLAELRSASTEELVKEHDRRAENTQAGVNYFLEELSRHDQEANTKAMLRLTWWITVMTAVIVAATIVNVGLFALD